MDAVCELLFTSVYPEYPAKARRYAHELLECVPTNRGARDVKTVKKRVQHTSLQHSRLPS